MNIRKRCNDKSKETLYALFYKSILVMTLVLCTYSAYRSIFKINSTSKALNIYNVESYLPSDLSPVLLLMGVAIYLGVLYQLYKLFSNSYFDNKKTIIYGAAITIVFFLALFQFTSRFTINPNYDLSHITREAFSLATGNTDLHAERYFERYPNNLAITVILTAVYKAAGVFGIDDYHLIGNVFGSLLMTTTAMLCFGTVRRLKNNGLALLTLVVFVTNPLFYLYASYYYSDVMSLPLSMLGIYLFVRYRKMNQTKVSNVLLVVCGMIAFVGYKVRATLIILVIAVILWSILVDHWKRTLKVIVFLLFGMLIAKSSFKAMNVTSFVTPDKTVEVPVVHWIMMGLNDETTGKYNQNDLTLTQSNETYDEKVKNDITELKKRAVAKGLGGMFIHCKEKVAIVWSDGFGVPSLFKNQQKYTRVYDYSVGSKSIFMRYYAQVCRSAMLLLVSLYLLVGLVKKRPEKDGLVIALLGAFVFYILWEANERYSLCFLPWIFILMMQGMENLVAIRNGKVNSIEFLPKVIRGAAIVVIGLSVVVMLYNKDLYTEKTSQFTELSYYKPTVNYSVKFIPVADKKIVQTFATGRAFNELSFVIDKNNVKSVTNYTISIYEKDKKIRTVQVDTDQINNPNELKVKFDVIKPKKKTKYSIEIVSSDATGENSINMRRNHYWDDEKSSVLTINDKKQKTDLCVKASRTYETTYTSTWIYFAICVGILVIECFAFRPFITIWKREN